MDTMTLAHTLIRVCCLDNRVEAQIRGSAIFHNAVMMTFHPTIQLNPSSGSY